jgi:hypothetical protein
LEHNGFKRALKASGIIPLNADAFDDVRRQCGGRRNLNSKTQKLMDGETSLRDTRPVKPNPRKSAMPGLLSVLIFLR